MHERERKQQFDQALRADRPNLQNGLQEYKKSN